MGSTLATQEDSKLETLRAPKGVKGSAPPGETQTIDVSAIVSVASHTFTFRENSNTPGRLLEQSVVLNGPPGAGFIVSLSFLTGAFTTANFQQLTERPLGQFYVGAGFRGNNLVCNVRLTDSNLDDPIFIQVTASVLFFT